MEEEEFQEELEAMEEDMEDVKPSEGERGRSVWWTLKHLMTTPVAHTTLACCGGTTCTWPGGRLMWYRELNKAAR